MMFFILIASALICTTSADPVVDCVSECRTNNLEFNPMFQNFTCNCGQNCTQLITEPACETRCETADDYDYLFFLNSTTLCNRDTCKCVCPPLLTQSCSSYCNSNFLQFLSYTQRYDNVTNCNFENCTCGQVCQVKPTVLKDCPLMLGKRAASIVYQVDKFGCPDNVCIYEDCADNINDFPNDKETFCWKTCDPFTYPQGCFETTLDASQCLKCKCGNSLPTANSCGSLPSFSVSLTPENCQHYCNSVDLTTNKNQGVVVTSPVRKCDCIKFTDLTCDDFCLKNESRHGKLSTQCKCQNLPSKRQPLKKRCTEVCAIRNKTWSGTVVKEKCICL